MNRKANVFRKCLRAGILAILLLLALMCGLFALAMTPWGLQQLTPMLESRITQQTGMDTQIQGLALRWPLELQATTFTATDQEGEIRLALYGFRARISLRQMLRRNIHIHHVEAEKLIFAGLPEREEKPPRPHPKEWEFPIQLPDLEPILDAIDVRHFNIQHLVLSPPFMPEPYTLSLSGYWQKRKLSLEGIWVSRGDQPFSDPPHIKTKVKIHPFNQKDERDLTLDIHATSLAKLLPDWPKDLSDKAELHVNARETRHKKVAITTAKLHTEPVTMEGDGELHLETGMLKITSHAEAQDLSQLQNWSPVAVAGSLQAAITIEGRLDDPAADVTLQSEHLQINDYTLESVNIRYRGQLLSLTREGGIDAQITYRQMPLQGKASLSFESGIIDLQDLSIEGPDLEANANLAVQLQPLRMQGQVMTKVTDFAPIGEALEQNLAGNAHIQGEMNVQNGVQSIIFDTIAIHWNELQVETESPLHLLMEPEHFRFKPVTLQVGRGRISAEGTLEGEHPTVNVEFLDLPLDVFGFAEHLSPDTELKGQFAVSGTLQNPNATLSLDVDGLRPESPDRWDGPPARFHLNLNLHEQRLQGGVRLENLPGDPITLDLNIPAPLSLMPFSFQWPPEGTVEAHLSANTDLTGLGRLFVLDVYHRLVGTLAADVKLAGTFDDPRLDGSIRLEGGRYEHELSGTILSDITLEVAAEREFLSIENFRASDGAAGTLHASGRMHFNPAERYPFETTLTLDRFRLMQNDHAEAIGRGTLEWDGNLDESQLSGQIRVNPMTLNIPETLPPRLHDLEVIEIHETADHADLHDVEEPQTVASTVPARQHQIDFDVRIDAPDRVFVRGRGLDSEWSAHIQVDGRTPEPFLTGSLEIIRGRFMFFGKRLVIQQGSITFDGSYPPAPLLDIEATMRTREIMATLRLQGPVTDPDISLHSSPPLPEDEILARILFGRATARLTPWQAITLAQAVNSLRGGGSTFDIMGETRRILGVDQIDIRTPDDEDTGTTITVGKYISDRVYVELERGVSEQSGRATVEVELTPTLRLETQTGGNVDSGIGILWTLDY